MDADRKLKMLAELYTFVFDAVESFESEDRIGADLAYLMGAIVRGERCQWYADRPLLYILREGGNLSLVTFAMQYIEILPEE